MNEAIHIRKLKTLDEVKQIQSLELDVWGMDPIPIHQTFTAVKNGGLIIGAFDVDRIVAFSYSFAGFQNGKAYLCSHMLGTHPDYQLMGIGKLLKDEQRKYALEMGYDLITWTFDPLESRNGYLNLSKLFGICDQYIVNCYGEMEDGINKGLPTDRFQVEWWIASERVAEQWTPSQLSYHNPFTVEMSPTGNVQLHIPDNWLLLSAEGYEIPVPEHIQLIKRSEPALAMDWRLKIRQIFLRLFESGYAIIGIRRTEEGVQYYQAVKRSSIPLASTKKGE